MHPSALPAEVRERFSRVDHRGSHLQMHFALDGKQAVSAFSLWFPVEANEANHGEMRAEMGRRVIEKISRLAPDFDKLIIRHSTFTPRHMGTMFGAPGGDYCHGLIHPDQMGPNRPGPTGYVGQPLPIEGLHLGSAGCHGGPGITFIPGYNAAKRALADSIGHRFCV